MSARKRYRIGIVASCYNEKYVDGLIASARSTLGTHAVRIARVPGAFEIPLAVQRFLQLKSIDGVIALGVVWQGQTAHADLIGETVSSALMQLMLAHDKPVTHAVLMVDNEKQARARCLGKRLNRGVEAAEALLAVLKGVQ